MPANLRQVLFYLAVIDENALDIDPVGVSRSLRLSVWEGASYSVMVGFAEVYFIPLLLALGGTDFQVGLLVAMIQLFLGFSQFAGLAILELVRRRKPILVTAGVAHIVFVLLMLLGVVSGRMSPIAFILVSGCYFAAVGTSIPSWTSLMGDLTSFGARGEYFGKRNSICQAVFLVCMLAGGGILELCDNRGIQFTGFSIILAVALLGRAGSTYAYSLFYENPYQHVKEAYFSFLDFLRRGGKANFTKFVFFLSMMNLSVQVAAPYYTAYMLNDLGFSYIQFTAATSVFFIAMILATRRFGLIADRYGNRIILENRRASIPGCPAAMVGFD